MDSQLSASGAFQNIIWNIKRQNNIGTLH